MENNEILRAKYNQLDNYCKRLAGLSDNESGIFLLEKILDYEQHSVLKTIRKFKNDFISHSGTFYTPEAPIDYVVFIDSLIDYVHDNENDVREKFRQLKNKNNSNYHHQSANQNNNCRPQQQQQKPANNFRNYPEPPNGYPEKKFFTYSSTGYWYNDNVSSSFFVEMIEDICDTIVEYEHFDRYFTHNFQHTGLFIFENDLGGHWTNRSPIPYGTKFYLLKKKVSYNTNALCLFNTKGTLYGSVILVIQNTNENSLTTFGLFYFICEPNNPKKSLITKMTQGYKVYLTREDLRDY